MSHIIPEPLAVTPETAKGLDTSGRKAPRFAGIKRFAAKYKLDKFHYAERSLIFLMVFALSGLLIILAAAHADIKKNAHTLTNKALYTTQFVTSKSQVQGTVAGIFDNPAHTKSMVLMQMSDMSKMPADAKVYQGFITGSSPKGEQQEMKSSPAGSVYVFGTTGYIGVFLANNERFDNQIVSLTMRSNSQIVTPDSSSSLSDDTVNAGASFQKYDQWRVFFNPGASGATTATALDEPTLNMSDLYYQMVSQHAEAGVRQKLDTDLAKMKTDIAAINSYTQTLTTTSLNGVHVMAPKVSPYLSGDQVTGDAAYGNHPSTLAYHPSKVLPNGFDFNWRDSTVQKGYLNAIVPKNMDYVTYLSAHANMTAPDVSFNSTDWKMSDGSDWSDYSSTSAAGLQSSVATINNQINLLTSAYQSYFSDKTLYEVNDLGGLLGLEVDLRGVAANNSVNTTSSAIVRY